MSLISLYRSTLKKKGSEELFDLILFRPLGFLAAYILKNTPVTPNIVTLTAMALGVASGLSFYFYSFELGAVFLFMSNWLDCSDGQLARLKKVSSKMGMILDGAADYVVYISINLGAFLAVIRDRGNLSVFWTDWIFWAGLAAGISTVIQAGIFDDYRNRFVGNSTLESMEEERSRFEAFRLESRNPLLKGILFFYLIYIQRQIQFRRRHPDLKVSRILIRLLSFTGSTTHVVLFIVFALLHWMPGYLLVVAGIMNLYLVIILLFKNKLNQGVN